MRIGVNQYDDPGNTKTGEGPARPAADAKMKAADVLKPVDDVNPALGSLSVDKEWVV